MLVSVLCTNDIDPDIGTDSHFVVGRKRWKKNKKNQCCIVVTGSSTDCVCPYQWSASAGFLLFDGTTIFRWKLSLWKDFFCNPAVDHHLSGRNGSNTCFLRAGFPEESSSGLPIIPGILLLVWNIFNILRVPFVLSVAGDMTAVCCLLIAAIFQSCILCRTDTYQQSLFWTVSGQRADFMQK